MRLSFFWWRVRKLKRRRPLRPIFFVTAFFVLFIRSIFYSSPRRIHGASHLPPANVTVHAPSPSPQPAASRELTNAASGAGRLETARFPLFYRCLPGGGVGAPPPSSDGCLEFRSSPSNLVPENGTFMVHVARDGCGFGRAMRTAAAEMNLTLFTISTLSPQTVDFADSPLPVIGTSTEHARPMTTGALAELVTHIAVWREVFSSNAASALVVTDGYIPRSNIPMNFAGFHLALLDDRAGAYVVSREATSRILAHTTAFVRPLPELLMAQARMKRVSIVHVREGAEKVPSYSGCDTPLRNSGTTVMSDTLPFYPPHHPLYEINE